MLLLPLHSNTSHVLIYLIPVPWCWIFQGYSNTSHVLIYRDRRVPESPVRFIQIHLMFLFIQNGSTPSRERKYSNTSHVLIYLPGQIQCITCNMIQIHLMFLFIMSGLLPALQDTYIQIHLMFLFIKIHPPDTIHRMPFKYISCSYLSKSTRPTQFIECHSNTSHVLIYPFMALPPGNPQGIQIHLMFLFIQHHRTPEHRRTPFKYISCSYLSKNLRDVQAKCIKFKYISCSYLSIKASKNGSVYFDSNTSHVLIYQVLQGYQNMIGRNSNTSHVLIYPLQGLTAAGAYLEFKYISCSYLSDMESFPMFSLLIQIHLMFLFIQFRSIIK